MKIVTHGGQAHVDDFLSCCLLLTKYEAEIWRVTKVDGEICQQDDIVVDVGGEYDSRRKRYDHHQNQTLPCSVLLVLRHEFGFSDSDLPRAVRYVDVRDRYGPGEANKFFSGYGMSLVETLVLATFSAADRITVGSSLWLIMKKIGELLLAYLAEYFEAKKVVEKGLVGRGHEVVVVSEKRVKIELLKEVVETLYGINKKLVGVVMPNSRNSNQTDVIRVDDAENFQPSKLTADVIFKHASGFLTVLSIPVSKLDVEKILSVVWG